MRKSKSPQQEWMIADNHKVMRLSSDRHNNATEYTSANQTKSKISKFIANSKKATDPKAPNQSRAVMVTTHSASAAQNILFKRPNLKLELPNHQSLLLQDPPTKPSYMGASVRHYMVRGHAYGADGPKPSHVDKGKMPSCFVEGAGSAFAAMAPRYLERAIPQKPGADGRFHISLFNKDGTRATHRIEPSFIGTPVSANAAGGKLYERQKRAKERLGPDPTPNDETILWPALLHKAFIYTDFSMNPAKYIDAFFPLGHWPLAWSIRKQHLELRWMKYKAGEETTWSNTEWQKIAAKEKYISELEEMYKARVEKVDEKYNQAWSDIGARYLGQPDYAKATWGHPARVMEAISGKPTQTTWLRPPSHWDPRFLFDAPVYVEEVDTYTDETITYYTNDDGVVDGIGQKIRDKGRGFISVNALAEKIEEAICNKHPALLVTDQDKVSPLTIIHCYAILDFDYNQENPGQSIVTVYDPQGSEDNTNFVTEYRYTLDFLHRSCIMFVRSEASGYDK